MNRVRRLLAVVLLIIPAIVVSAWAADEPGCSTALLITDIQPVWLNAGGYDKADNVPITSKTADNVDQVRPAGVPVIYIVDVMLRGVEPDEAIGTASPPAVLEGDLLYEKRYPDSFFQTSLSDDLRALGVTTVFLTGVASRGCAVSTTRCLERLRRAFRRSWSKMPTRTAWAGRAREQNDLKRDRGYIVIPGSELDLDDLCEGKT